MNETVNIPSEHDLFVTGVVDGVGEGPFELLWHCLLHGLGDDAVAGGMALGARGAGVVDRVGDVLLDALGELLLSLVGDDGVAAGVGFTLAVFVLHLGGSGLDGSLVEVLGCS